VAFDEEIVVRVFNFIYLLVFCYYSCWKGYKRSEVEAWCHWSSQWTYSRHNLLPWTNSRTSSRAYSSKVRLIRNYSQTCLSLATLKCLFQNMPKADWSEIQNFRGKTYLHVNLFSTT